MKQEIKTGGTAFPVESVNWRAHGMTLRDYFAARAIQEMAWADDGRNDPRARICYEIADAMLRARDGGAV